MFNEFECSIIFTATDEISVKSDEIQKVVSNQVFLIYF